MVYFLINFIFDIFVFCISLYINHDSLKNFEKYWTVNNFKPKLIKQLVLFDDMPEIDDLYKGFEIQCLKKLENIQEILIINNISFSGYFLRILHCIKKIKTTKLQIRYFFSSLPIPKDYGPTIPKSQCIYLNFANCLSSAFNGMTFTSIYAYNFQVNENIRLIFEQCKFLFIGYNSQQLQYDSHYLQSDVLLFIKGIAKYLKELDTKTSVKVIDFNSKIIDWYKENIKDLYFLIDVCKEKQIYIKPSRKAIEQKVGF